MIKKLTFTFGCLALLASLSSVALADAITFNFIFGGATTVQHSAAGLSASQGVVIDVSDDTTLTHFTVLGLTSVKTGPTASWGVSSGILNASFGPGGLVDITSLAGLCPPLCGSTLLSGTMEDGSLYSATLGGGNGSFHGLFNVTYVSPEILGLFGLGPSYLPDGSVSLNTSKNKMVSLTKETAKLAGGTITIDTPTPEPGTMALFGSGIIGIAGILRRKINL